MPTEGESQQPHGSRPEGQSREDYDRTIKENNDLIAAPLNSLVEQLERYKVQQQINDERRACREIATIVGLAVTGLLTLLGAVIFFFQLNQMRIATRHGDEAARTQHADTRAALQRAEDANALTEATAKRQAADTAVSLGLSKQAADAATKAVDTNVAGERARLLVGDMMIKRANEQDLNPTISSKVINIGRTSALVTGTSVECAVADLPAIGSTPTYNQQRFRYAMSLVNAGNEIPMPGSDCALDKPITTDELVALSVRTKIILLKGFVIYQDVFGEKFTQRFAYYSYGTKWMPFIHSWAQMLTAPKSKIRTRQSNTANAETPLAASQHLACRSLDQRARPRRRPQGSLTTSAGAQTIAAGRHSRRKIGAGRLSGCLWPLCGLRLDPDPIEHEQGDG
jgi:hypothetical protein